jgi:hypothetical protein
MWLAEFAAARPDWCLLTIVPAAVVGALLPFTQRADTPDTHPVGGAIGELPSEIATQRLTSIKLDADHFIFPLEPEIAIAHPSAAMSIVVRPLLTFDSRAPDGCWTLLARQRDRVGPPRQLVAAQQDESRVTLKYRDDGISTLRIGDGLITRIEAQSRLPAPVWSHLNTFTTLLVAGHRELAIAFSPSGDTPIAVRPVGYPFGLPARFAYLDGGGVFHVVEASSAEKGPFHGLVAGALKRGDPLALTFFDRGVAVFRVTLDDWSAQASTQISPTAGWGVPVNAIEFSLQGDQPNSAAAVFITLAATSVGRGYDSVGHSAGVYRNRMSIERLMR